MRPIFSALFAVLLSGLAPSLCLAEIAPANQNESAASFNAVDALVRQTRVQGDLPRWSNPEHAKILARFWNIEATLGKPPYRTDDVPALIAIGRRAGSVFSTYVSFTSKPGAAPDLVANTAKYQDEVVRGAAYLARVREVELEALDDFLKTTPPAKLDQDQRGGLLQARQGIATMISGVIQMAGSPELNTVNRNILLTELSGGSDIMATSMPLPQRAALAKQITAILPRLSGADRDKALTMKSAFERGGCERLCAVEAQ